MCLVKKPSISDYWAKKSILCTPFPSSVMSRNRFKAVLSNLHLNDNNNYIARNQPNHDLFNLIMDEGMHGFRGQIHFKVYMKGKPKKYGIKLFVVYDVCTRYV
ncbi:hypothetical protein PR048_001658 [Dryococelus australis]|uniref:PiggyBac transposable element-derived protein domain-containing protein n=1 Tax=Dryococelus australis TaxID=614101 RepID=A0ABQ9IHX3_9NEOP|nr:hypothetical protein PR048_001658 [Dryococelus australis]